MTSLKEYRKVLINNYSLFEAEIKKTLVGVLVENEVAQHVLKMIEYNIKDGKMIRSSMFCKFYVFIAQTDLENETIVLAWCIELLQAFFLIADDIMDSSDVRRGKPAWHKVVGAIAINDAFMLNTLIQTTMIKLFHMEQASRLLSVFNEVILKTQFGQYLDMFSCKKMDKFTLDQVALISDYKTAEYTFVLPLRLALCMSDLNESDTLISPVRIMGRLFQIHDDFLDISYSQSGKSPSDIEEGKCTWPLILALSCSVDPTGLFESYLSGDREAVLKVYQEKNIQESFLRCVNSYNDKVKHQFRAIPEERLRNLLNEIYDEIFAK